MTYSDHLSSTPAPPIRQSWWARSTATLREDPLSTAFLVAAHLLLAAALLNTANVFVFIFVVRNWSMAAMSAVVAVVTSGLTVLTRAKQRKTAQRARLDRQAKEEDRARAGRSSEGLGSKGDGKDSH